MVAQTNLAAPQDANDSDAEEQECLDDGEQGSQKVKDKRRRRRKKKNQPIEIELQSGVSVRIHGLTGAVELNGLVGICQDKNCETGRWHVKLSSGEVKALKPENLQGQQPPQSGSNDHSEWARKALESLPDGASGYSAADRLRMDDVFDGYEFSGALRPAFVTPQMEPPPGCCLPDYALHPEGIATSEIQERGKGIPVLEGEDLSTMKETCRLGREVLDIASKFMRAGVTGDEIDRIVWQACTDRKLYPSPLNYNGFPKSVCVSPNEVICHGIPDCRPLREGDIVNLDVSVFYRGFHADLNETFFIGKCDDDSKNLVCTAYNALRAAAELIRPGTLYRDLGAAIHSETVKNGCAVVPTYCGHGVGRLFHGPPNIPHYRKNKAVGVMKPGHVFTIEPMINVGSNGGDRLWPDDWTAVTKDGKRSAQFEHTFLVTENGYEVLTARPGSNSSSMPTFDMAMFQR
jgi:methionyl aminopeptidase